MSHDAHHSDVALYFGHAVASDDALVTECMSICKMYNITVEDLSYKWEALSYSNTRTLAIFTLKSVPDLKAKLQQDLDKLNATKLVTSRGGGNPTFTRGRGGSAGVPRTSTATALGEVLKIAPLRPSTIKSEFAMSSSPSRVVFEGPKPRSAYRYMYEKVTGRSEVLDDRIDEFADLVQRHYRIDELADPSATTEETTTVVGRIVHDAEVSASGAKFNESSLVLESSRMMGLGMRVPIRFTPETKLRGAVKGVGGMSFFPGAIVALRGRNGGGGFYLVEEVLSLPPITVFSPHPSANAAFSMDIACGPFSMESDLEYKPWKEFVEQMKVNQPAVLLLIGPFVDAANSCIKNGDIDEPLQQLFERQFTQPLKDFLVQSPDSLVLLVPSINDVISEHAVFPQCELNKECSKDPRIRLLPNPCHFSINGISFAVTSIDTLFHLRKDEFFRRMPEVDPLIPASEPATDAMSKLARNLLQQRSFYPIFPTPLDVAHEVNLDVTHLEGIKLVEGEGGCAPNVLVLPSRLKQFSKVVDGTTIINPSFSTKGTYAKLAYASQGSGPATDCITVDILKTS